MFTACNKCGSLLQPADIRCAVCSNKRARPDLKQEPVMIRPEYAFTEYTYEDKYRVAGLKAQVEALVKQVEDLADTLVERNARIAELEQRFFAQYRLGMTEGMRMAQNDCEDKDDRIKALEQMIDERDHVLSKSVLASHKPECECWACRPQF